MGLAVALMAAGVGLQAASQIQQGRAAEAQAKGEAAMADYNQKVSEQNAKAALLKSGFDQRRQARFGQRVMGTLRAKIGASGAMAEEGAPLQIETEQGAELALENALIGYEGQVLAGQHRSQAAMYGMERQLAKTRAGYAMKIAYTSAGATLLGGFGTMSQQGMFNNTKSTWSNTAKTTALRY
jgi:hypothetical protein